MQLIIAEKPSVAGEIAKVVGATKRENGYYSGKGYLVSWCIGHLIELADPESYDDTYKQWSLASLPIIPDQYKTEVSKSTAPQYKILKELMNRSDVTELVEATDAGREGELIFRLVYYKANCKKPFKRLWISSMEEESIKNGLKTMKDGKEYDSLYQAALCRQRADWLVGINATRLYTKLYDQVLKTGRVQTPTVNLIVKRQREIDNFIPLPYYTLSADLGDFKVYRKEDDKQSADSIVKTCTWKDARIEKVERQEKKEKPQALYDLTNLQRDANRILGYSAQQTLDYMQKLYDNKLATYPRTDSRYLTEDMEASTKNLIHDLLLGGIVSDTLSKNYLLKDINIKSVINNKKVSDHHAIIPTGSVTKAKLDQLPTGEKAILTLIIHRLLSAVYKEHKYASTKVSADIEGYNFTATGREVLEPGFKMIEDQLRSTLKSTPEKKDDEEAVLPAVKQGDIFSVKNIKSEEKKTQPPKYYTEDTLLAAMETAGKSIIDDDLRDAIKDRGLGTPATRASIIENIIKTGYINRDGKKLIATDIAFKFIDLVAEKLKEPEMTAEWEKQLADIQAGKMSDTAFMNEITGFVKTVVNDAKSTAPAGSASTFQTSKEPLGICPKCGKHVVETPKAFSCESGRDGCGFVIWKTVAGKTITKSMAEKLLKKGRTDTIKGFKSKAGKPFDSYLIIKEDKTAGFPF